MARRARGLLLVALCGCWAARLQADGCFLRPQALNAAAPSSAAQKAVLIAEGADEVLLLQTTYRGPAARFAWIVPVPSPPREVFAAEPAFLTEAFAGTEPAVLTKLGAPRHRWRQGEARPEAPDETGAGEEDGGPGGPGGPGTPPVQVLQETEVGDYHAAVLGAGATGALADWLRRNHYELPREAIPVLADYVRRQWVFVALRMNEQASRATPQLEDVPPLGLRFACPRGGLVYPLTISRISAPPLSALLLLVVGDQPYTCRTVPTVRLRGRVRLGREETYGALRRRLTRNPTRLLCEFAGEAPFEYANLGYRATDWEWGSGGGLHLRQASRFYGLLAPEAMDDLHFGPEAPSRAGSYRVLVRRRAPGPDEQVWDRLAAMAVLEAGSPQQAQARARRPQLLAPPAAGTLSDEERGRVLLVVVAAVLVQLLLAAPRRGGRLPLALLVAPLAVLLALWAPQAEGGAGPGLAVLQRVQEAAEAFAADTGGYPREVADLAARQAPAVGQDASGNEVPLRGWRGPYLEDTPGSPLPRARLVCDPLNCFLIDSTGFRLTCEAATGAQARQALGQPEPQARSYWQVAPRALAGGLQPYYHWLQRRRGHRLFAFGMLTTPDGVTGVVVDRTALSAFYVRRRGFLPGLNGEILSFWEARAGGEWQGAAPSQLCGALTTCESPFELLPRPPANASYVALGGQGTVLLQRLPGEGLLVTRPGQAPRELADSGRNGDPAVARDGSAVYYPTRQGLVRHDLRTGAQTRAAEGEQARSVCGPDGALSVSGGALHFWPLRGPRVRVATGLPAGAWPLAASEGYAYWREGGGPGGGPERLHRVRVSDGRSCTIPLPDDWLPLATDGADLYVLALRRTGESEFVLVTGEGKRYPLREGP